MVEPAGAFWIAHTRQTNSPLDVIAFLKQNHLRPAWINSIHTIGSALLPDLQAAGFKQECVIYRWGEPSFSQQRILHAALRSILLGEAELSLILVQSESRSAAVVLASHLAVGRYNLFPQIGFEGFSAFNKNDSSLLDQVKTALDRQIEEAGKTNALLLSELRSKRPVKKGSPFENAAWVAADEPPAGILDCCAVVDALISSRKKHGLAVEVELDGLVNWTAMERS